MDRKPIPDFSSHPPAPRTGYGVANGILDRLRIDDTNPTAKLVIAYEDSNGAFRRVLARELTASDLRNLCNAATASPPSPATGDVRADMLAALEGLLAWYDSNETERAQLTYDRFDRARDVASRAKGVQP